MDDLSRVLGCRRLWIKRDDCTGLSTGGKATRKLEFLMADAVAQKADVVITQGATQSNHAPATAARLGMRCHILLDPELSGKGVAVLIDLVRRGQFKQDENVVFLHTGGPVALFGYPSTFGPDAKQHGTQR